LSAKIISIYFRFAVWKIKLPKNAEGAKRLHAIVGALQFSFKQTNMDFDFENSFYQTKNKSVLALIEDFNKKYRLVFSKVQKYWVPYIREFLRDETGLKMRANKNGFKLGKDASTSFSFVTDHEEGFVKLVDKYYPELDFAEYAAFRTLYKEQKRSSKFFSNPGCPTNAFKEVENYLTKYFDKYNIDELIKNLFHSTGPNADIWGCYFYRTGKIEIYYIPLILFSDIKNISLEYAIVTTLVHEMAHAYHHMGKDRDNIEWSGMPSADSYIVEGFAEYYTWLFVEEYKIRYPDMESAYLEMFQCLGKEYTCFKEWTPKFSKEVIKTSLLTVRRKGIQTNEQFQITLKSLKQQMN
jgi:hypothetical protein